MVTITGKALGQRKPLFADFSVPPPETATNTPLTLRDLIAHVVRQEIAAFHDRQAKRRLLKALSPQQIADGLATGKVDSGGSDLDQKVDAEEAIRTAVEAFQDGLYMVVLDEEELKEIDQTVTLLPESRLTFIRLTMLAGG